VQVVVGRRKLWLATIINSIFPDLAMVLALLFLNRPCAAIGFATAPSTVASAITMCGTSGEGG
jgi:hypothetical protein